MIFTSWRHTFYFIDLYLPIYGLKNNNIAVDISMVEEMAKNFESLYLDVVNRIVHTKSDLVYMEKLYETIEHYLAKSDLGSLRDISEILKKFSGKNNDLRFTHPEIPWAVLIELSHVSVSQITPALVENMDSALKELKRAIEINPDASRQVGVLYQELKNRLAWQEDVLAYLTVFTQAEYGLFHLQLDLQELYCELANAALSNNPHDKIQRAINFTQIESTLSRYDILYLQLSQILVPGQKESARPNEAIFEDFNKIKKDLPDITALTESFQKLRVAYENYQHEWNAQLGQNTLDYKLGAAQDSLLKCVEDFIEKQALPARKQIVARDLANHLDNSYWRVIDDEDDNAFQNQHDLTTQYDFSGLDTIKDQLYRKQRTILADFALNLNNLCASKEPITLPRRMAKLYQLIVIGETVKELCAILSPLTPDEKKVLKKFITCRTALVHAADSPISRQNLWELLELDKVIDQDTLLSKEKETLIDKSLESVTSLIVALEARFNNQKNDVTTISNINTSGIEAVKNELYKKDSVVTHPFLLRNLTTVEVLLEKITLTLQDSHSSPNQKINSAMLTCIWLGQISKEINESSYAHSRTLLRHPEWSELAHKLNDASDLRAQFCHGFASNYMGNNQVQGQSQAIALIFDFQAMCDASNVYSDSIFSACEEKSFARDIARNLNFGVEAYPIYHHMMNSLLSDAKNILKVESAFNHNKSIKDNAAKNTLKKAIKAYLKNFINTYGIEKNTTLLQLKKGLLESPTTVTMMEESDNNFLVSGTLQHLARDVRDYFLLSAALEINKSSTNSPTIKTGNYAIAPEKAQYNTLDANFMAMHFESNNGATTPMIGSPHAATSLASTSSNELDSPIYSPFGKRSASLFAAFPDSPTTSKTNSSFCSPSITIKNSIEPGSTGERCGRKRTFNQIEEINTHINSYRMSFFKKGGLADEASSEYKNLARTALEEVENEEVKATASANFAGSSIRDKKRNNPSKSNSTPASLYSPTTK